MKKMAIGFVIILSVAMASNACAADEQMGKRVFDVYCKGCHEPISNVKTGEPPAGTYVLQQRYKDKIPAALEDREGMTPEFIKHSVRHGVNTPKAPGSVGIHMPPIRKTEVSDEELDDIVAYLTKSKK
jgi:mono/diheme cytochrome c family protein